MSTITLEEAQARLPELIERLEPGEVLVITKQAQPIAKLVAEPRKPLQPRQPGSAQGKLIIVSEDDEHLKDFEEYMS